MLEVVTIHLAIIHNKLNNIRSCIWNLNRVCFDMGYSKASLLNLVLEVHHEERTAFSYNVVDISFISERIVKLSAC